MQLRRPLTRRLLLGLIGLSFMTGCGTMAGLQDLQFSMANRSRAKSAWRNYCDRQERGTLSGDFASGFKQGYFDTAMGKDCRLPPIAPPKYWAAKYQSCEGQCSVQDWFRGYQYGINAAQSGACPSFAEVPVSPHAPVLNKTGCGTCYSSSHCHCGTSGCNGSCGNSADATDYKIMPSVGRTPSGSSEGEQSSEQTQSKPEKATGEVPAPQTRGSDDPAKKSSDEDSSASYLSPDLTNSRAIVPASFGQVGGLIGGYGVSLKQPIIR
jgi:hypothetical protein